MRVRIKVTNLTKEEVSTIFADGLDYGYLHIKLDARFRHAYSLVEDKSADKCIESMASDILFAGMDITVVESWFDFTTGEYIKKDHSLCLADIYKACDTRKGYEFASRMFMDEDHDCSDAFGIIRIALNL